MIGAMQNYKTFNRFYLVEPNKSVTHRSETNKGTARRARKIYNIITYKQRVCKKFFINFLHVFLACINEQILCAKTSKVLFVIYK